MDVEQLKTERVEVTFGFPRGVRNAWGHLVPTADALWLENIGPEMYWTWREMSPVTCGLVTMRWDAAGRSYTAAFRPTVFVSSVVGAVADSVTKATLARDAAPLVDQLRKRGAEFAQMRARLLAEESSRQLLGKVAGYLHATDPEVWLRNPLGRAFRRRQPKPYRCLAERLTALLVLTPDASVDELIDAWKASVVPVSSLMLGHELPPEDSGSAKQDANWASERAARFEDVLRDLRRL